ncbi:MAG: ATP-grasp domain-containing protein [Candidatus Thalassarchaeaceae archaeon]|nr:ATP-grasp domain-containing protein [Candidatus Thalassarchaeaceae archaeon]
MIPEWMKGASTPFSSVLVANRGEIAVRIIKAVQEAGLRAIAVYSNPDKGALHTELADHTIHLPGDSLSENYLNSDAIIQAAKLSGAQAIHPGYGFLSERADFARAVERAGIIWIGPSPEAIETMGDKISARSRMIESGVPVIPGDEIAIPDDSDHLGILASVAARVGYPLLLKASAGGGGKGMRIVREPKMLRTEYEAAAREASAAFGDGTVYVERLLTGARHIEIQILADKLGNCIHLNERDCSLQRRHQKVIEEAPSSVVSEDLRRSMGESAVLAAKSVNYVGAGTVELLLSANGEFYFLEMNTRLQVEHPITEMITGIDLVQKQLEIASGLPIGIRQESIGISGHSIEARIYAEDAKRGFLPSIGKLAVWRPPSGPGIRFDSGVKEGDEVTVNFDPMLAKLIVHAPSRMAAIRRMDLALSSFIALGVTTNIGFLRNALTHPAFTSGSITTDFLDNTPISEFHSEGSEPSVLVAIAAASKRLGVDRSGGGLSQVFTDDHTGHAGDPFQTLSRSFP